MDSPHLAEFAKQRAQVAGLLDEVCQLASEANGLCNVGELGQTMRENARALAEGRFRLAVVGEFSSGKSYFINVLLGRVREGRTQRGRLKVLGLLPDRLPPTTSTITVLQFGSPEEARVVYCDGHAEVVSMDRLEAYLAEPSHAERYSGRGKSGSQGRRGRSIHHVEIRCESPWLANGIEVVDTPGTGSILEEHAAITREFLPSADAVVFLFAAQPPINNQAKLFLSQCRFQTSSFFFVQTMKDRHFALDGKRLVPHREPCSAGGPAILGVLARAADVFSGGAQKPSRQEDDSVWAVATQQNEAILADVLGYVPRVHGISSRWRAWRLLGYETPADEEIGFASLQEHLEEFLVQARGLVNLRDHVQRAQAGLHQMVGQLAALRAQQGKSLEEVEGRLRAQEPVVREVVHQARGLQDLVTRHLGALRATLADQELDAYESLRREVSQRIHRMSARELQDAATSLAYCVQQALNAWVVRLAAEKARPALQCLRQELGAEVRALKHKLEGLAELAGDVARATNSLSAVSAFRITVPEASALQSSLGSSVASVVEARLGGLLGLALKLPVVQAVAGLLAHGRIEEVRREMDSAIEPVLRRVAEEAVSSYSETLLGESEASRNSIQDATERVIQQYNGTLKGLRDSLVQTQTEVVPQMAQLDELQCRARALLGTCDALLQELRHAAEAREPA